MCVWPHIFFKVDLQGEFKGEGEDKQGQFEVRGTVQGAEVRYIFISKFKEKKQFKENLNILKII